MRTTFITGCGSGFGRGLAIALLRRGEQVVATEAAGTSPDALRRLLLREAPGAAARLLCLALDVREDAAVAAAAAAALAWAPIDVVVNNAGYAWFAAIEEGEPSAFAELLAVNVVGVARVTRALLPSVRARAGAVVMLSSVAGRTVFAESGYYAATKHAVEALAEALHQETCTFGVKVRLIEPGSFDTGFLGTAAALSPPRAPGSPYAALRPTWDARKAEVLEPPQDPAGVVEAIVTSLDDRRPFARVPVGPDAERLLGLRDALGADAWARLAADRHGLDPDLPRLPGDVLSPASVLAAGALGGQAPGMRATIAAYHWGHLAHWASDPVGRRALARLAAAETEVGDVEPLTD